MIPAGRVVGVDLGSRRIGVAVSDSGQTVATPVTTIDRTGDPATDQREVLSVVQEYGAVGVVVGLPLSLSGSAGRAAVSAMKEVESLRQALGVEVDTVDERFTTRVAASGLRASGRRARRHREVIDAAAAAELLQTWLSSRRAAVRDS
jgi:putative Holliday junction resolvase